MELNGLAQALRAHAEDDWLLAWAEQSGQTRTEALATAGRLLGYPVMESAAARDLRLDYSACGYVVMARVRLLVGLDSAANRVAVLAQPLHPALARTLLAVPELDEIYLAAPDAVDEVLASAESGVSAMAQSVDTGAVAHDAVATSEGLDLSVIEGESSPAVRLISSTLYDALRQQASDIHLETIPSGLVIKFRIDGVLVQVGAVRNAELAEHAIARVKVMAELDIAEKRKPQDGRFRTGLKGRDIDIRVSIMPSIHGEDAVLRILDKQTLVDELRHLTLDSLGFDARTIRLLRQMAGEPYGMLLVTGPTGSGKTTTLYAALTEINKGEDKIITIEDPVEYQLPGVLQIPVNEKKGLSFAVGLRSILRHDPDKILVGEIRDPETAQIAVQSALTGHLVFTSVHANNSFDVIARFMHMGVDPYNFVSSLSGVVAQRLVRVICAACAEPGTPPDSLLETSNLGDTTEFRFMHGRGCAQCRHTGFRGRRAIAEVLRLTDELREMIVARAPLRALKEQARREGTQFLRDVAIELVRTGQTTLQEANRVTFVA